MNTNDWGAMRINRRLIRQRPWVSDATWIAHESLPLISHLAAMLPSNGRWRMTERGPIKRNDWPDAPNLAAVMSEVTSTSTPCVVNWPTYERHETKELAAQSALDSPQVVEVLDADGRTWLFDNGIVEVLTVTERGARRDDLSFRLGYLGAVPVLVGIDRKDRPRFVLAGLKRQEEAA